VVIVVYRSLRQCQSRGDGGGGGRDAVAPNFAL
jgi:hypothetical protein